MANKYWIVSMPEGFNPEDWKAWESSTYGKALANAKEAVEADLNEVKCTIIHGYDHRVKDPKINDKPVKLFAVKENL